MDITKLLKLANVYDKRMSKKAELSIENRDTVLESHRAALRATGEADVNKFKENITYMNTKELKLELELISITFSEAQRVAQEKVLIIKRKLEGKESQENKMISQKMNEEFTKGRDPGGMSLEDLY